MTGPDIQKLHHDAQLFIGYMNPHPDCSPDGGISFSTWARGSDYMQGSLPNLRAGGVDIFIASFGLNHPDLFPGRAGVGRVIQQLGAFSREVQRHSDTVAIATNPSQLHDILQSGRMAAILHLNGALLDGAIEILQAYRDLGVWTIHTPFDATVSARPHAWKSDAGLTPFDRDVLREMLRLHMVIDLAHANETMSLQIIDMVDRPVINTHTMCRAVTDHPRNSSDTLHRAIAQTGGVVGIHFAGQLIDIAYEHAISQTNFHQLLQQYEADLHAQFPDPFHYMAARNDYARWHISEARRVRHTVQPPGLDRVLDHVDHLVQTIGIDHVGIGSDYDLGNMPAELNSAEKLPALTHGLASRGYSDDHIRAILGGNFLRVFSAAG